MHKTELDEEVLNDKLEMAKLKQKIEELREIDQIQ